MNLSEQRFSQYKVVFYTVDGKPTMLPVYTYSTKNTIYDVLVVNDRPMVRINGGDWSKHPDDWTPIHYAICNHFQLTKPE